MVPVSLVGLESDSMVANTLNDNEWHLFKLYFITLFFKVKSRSSFKTMLGYELEKLRKDGIVMHNSRS